MSSLASNEKVCYYGSSDGSVTGPKWYTLGVPLGATLDSASYIIDPPGDPPTTYTYDVGTCVDGNQAQVSASTVDCFNPTVVSTSTDCGTDPTGGCSTQETIMGYGIGTPSGYTCTNTNWVDAATVLVGPDTTCDGTPTQYTTDQTKSLSGARSCSRTIGTGCLANIPYLSDREISLPFSATVTETEGFVSIAGSFTKPAGGTTWTLALSSVTAQANIPLESGGAYGTSCATPGTPSCPTIRSLRQDFELAHVVLPCSSTRITIYADIQFDSGGANRSIYCCLCSSGSYSGGGSRQWTYTVQLLGIKAVAEAA